MTCAQLGDNCGGVSDGCSAVLSCGTCSAPDTCGGTGAPNFCGTSAGPCVGLCQDLTTCSNGGTTSISGTVYAPNGTDPLPNVLVYVPNSAVEPFTPGVACELAGETASGSPLVSTTTRADGTFTLKNMPVRAEIPLVIQAGRWRRQLVISNVSSCQNTALPATFAIMPSSQAEGDIPKIAIVTGAVDATECALRKIGIADSEFTDPPALGGTGRINLYLGDSLANSTTGSGPGAQISGNTPSETELEGTQAAMNQYDLLIYSCQGTEISPTANQLQTLLNYVNAGGRVYATHYAYGWLDNAATFQGTADWDLNQGEQDNGTGLINQTFPEGLELAQWLQSTGATTTLGQIPLDTLREDFNGVVAPSELWITLTPGGGSFPMQYTFNTPVGVSAANQCGRVQFNDYHVEDTTSSPTTGVTFPDECVSGPTTAQEKLLEYNLFDLTNFLAPDVPPAIAVGFVNGPATFKQNDESDTAQSTSRTPARKLPPATHSPRLSLFRPALRH